MTADLFHPEATALAESLHRSHMIGNAAVSQRATSKSTATTASRAPRVVRAWLLLPVGLFCVGVIVVGWRTRSEYYVVPDEGLGYALGIVGLSMLVLLLLYSLRKRSRALASAGALQHWFHIHMALGLLGPTAILAHSNFSLGSLNANVALLCMLVVSASGIVGRFIYTHIHYEYRGHVASLAELHAQASGEGDVLAEAIRHAPGISKPLEELRGWAFAERGAIGRLVMMTTIGMRVRASRRRARSAWRRCKAGASGAVPSTRDVRNAIRVQTSAIRRVAEYSTYERFFALWHALHLPFCVGLYLAAAVHVVAVHMY